ncbi:MAG: 2Fe-2S iron-sulfur cluster-binding protein, partial [Paracoccaceae bacterium]|nr:2Fe-2S iron-sulfur cluster-binding protein [Paracoccaceae bacterium]
LSRGGRLINRAKRIVFSFNGTKMDGYEGDTLASALLANDQMLVGRSFKYHRPRGIVASGAEEPNGLVHLGQEARFEPNQRVTTTELFEGLTASSQNHWPSLEFDISSINTHLAQFLPAGFYYKMFMYPQSFWKHVYEPIIRRSAGLGRPPTEPDADFYEHLYMFVDVLVIGGGIAGLLAAKEAGASGAQVLLLEQTADWGGRSLNSYQTVNSQPMGNFVDELLTELVVMPNVTLRNRTMGAGIYDHGYVLGYERLTDHCPGAVGPRHRLWRIRAKQVITATGAIERPLSFAGNDIPGVMLASAVRDYVDNWGVSTGDRTVVVTNNDDAYTTAIVMKKAGLDVPVILDARSVGGGAIAAEAAALGIRIEMGKAIAKVSGGKRVTSVSICSQAGEGAVLEEINCDVVAMSGGWSPVVHLWSHCGGKLMWDALQAQFRPDEDKAPLGADGAAFVAGAGSANGEMSLGGCLRDAEHAGQAAAQRAGFTPQPSAALTVTELETAPIEMIWVMPQGAGIKLRSKAWLDYQNDVKVSDVQLAAQEGFESVEHAKRYTTLGMATDQGKLSNINGLAILSDSLNADIPQTGTTTFRPPYTPISMGAIAGHARGDIFQPLRQTPIHDWHVSEGAYMEPVGGWRRPYCFPRNGENHMDAVAREINQTRRSLGLLDSSTLGKLLVTGPDAGKFLD